MLSFFQKGKQMNSFTDDVLNFGYTKGINKGLNMFLEAFSKEMEQNKGQDPIETAKRVADDLKNGHRKE